MARELSAHYKSAAVKLSREIKTQARNEKEEAQEQVCTLTALQAAQLEVIRFNASCFCLYIKRESSVTRPSGRLRVRWI